MRGAVRGGLTGVASGAASATASALAGEVLGESSGNPGFGTPEPKARTEDEQFWSTFNDEGRVGAGVAAAERRHAEPPKRRSLLDQIGASAVEGASSGAASAAGTAVGTMAKAAWTRALSEPEAERAKELRRDGTTSPPSRGRAASTPANDDNETPGPDAPTPAPASARRPPLDRAAVDPVATADRLRSVDDRPGANRPDEAYLADRAAAFRAAERRDRAASAYVPPLSLLEEPLPRPPYNLLTGRMSPEFRESWDLSRERAEGGWEGAGGKLGALARAAPPATPRDGFAPLFRVSDDLETDTRNLETFDRSGKSIRYAEAETSGPDTQTDAHGARSASTETGDHQPPAIRRYVFEANPTWWPDFIRATRNLPEITESEAFILPEIYGIEGGNRKNKISSASSGILQRTLDNVKRLGLTWGLDDVREPKDMTTEQRPRVLRAVLDTELRTVDPAYGRNGGSFLLETVGNRYAAAALADTLIRHGGPDGATLIQKAINDVKPNSVTVDGALGSRTWAAYKALAQDPMRSSALLVALGERRIAKFKDEKNDKEIVRAEYFKYSDRK